MDAKNNANQFFADAAPGSFELFPVADRQASLADRFPVWEPRTLDQMLDAAAAEFPERPYVMTDERTWSYCEMQVWSQRIAAGLASQGVRPGDHVAVVMANQPEFVALKFGIARAGAVAVPINFLNRRDELAYVLKQSDSTLLVTMDGFRDLDYLKMLDELVPGWEQTGGGDTFPKLKRVVVLPTGERDARTNVTDFESLNIEGPVPAPAHHPEDMSDILYTSGTTGSPKGVMLTHDMLLRTAFGSAYSRAFKDGQRILFSLPMYHVYGYVEGLLSVLFVGGSIVPRLKFEAQDTLKAIERHRVSDLLLIPTMTLALIEELQQRFYDLSSLQTLISSGGRAPKTIWSEILTHLEPQEITTGYGMTEVSATTTVTRPNDPVQRLRTNGRVRDVGPVGDPELDGALVAYRVVDPATEKPVGIGEVGELQAKGLGVTAGYYNKPEATAATFTMDGWLKTGDLGRFDSDGYLTLVGRSKESYRCGGEQVLPSEVEDVLSSHPGIAQAHVVPVPDRRMGEVGAAFIVLSGAHSAEPEEIIEFCKQRLARFKVPKHVLFINTDDVPVTPSGRPRKFLMAEKACEMLGLS